MRSSPLTFLGGAACYTLLACLLYYAGFASACGRYIKSEWWIKDISEYKLFLNHLIPSPRILIAGGSNALFGIDSDVINRITGRNVLNMSSHAGLDISFHYRNLEQYMREGDIVVIPLEYNYYYQESPYTDWFVDNMIAWGKEDYLDRLNIGERIKFIFHVPKKKLFALLTSDEEPPLTDRNVVILSIVNSLHHGWKGYNFKSMNKNGEILVAAGPVLTAPKFKKGIPYLKDAPISDHFIEYFKKIENLSRERHGKVILTWPPSVRNPLFDLSTAKHKDRVQRLRQDLDKAGIRLSCDPEMFNMDVRNFFDTEYHLNQDGARIRSERLAHCINDLLPGKDGG